MASTTTDIIGSFVFRNEGEGCLTSKYHNKDSAEGPFTECSKFEQPLAKKETVNNSIPNNFCGIYKTTWIEDGLTPQHSDLKIRINPLNKNIFILNWYDGPQNIFEGTAMLFGDLLVGTYWGS